MNNGDDDYPQYNLHGFIASERSFVFSQGEVDPKKVRAFTIANKALKAIESNKPEDAKKMAYHALSLDPFCIDAWRILCNVLNPWCDGDTIVCMLREIVDFARPFYAEEFKQTGKFYSLPRTRPYIRLLTDLAKTALRGEQLDVAIYAYEETIRLNYHDNMLSRDPLLCCYVKIIGRIHNYPKTKPVRTIEQVQRFIDSELDGNPLFNKDTLTVRWAQLCFAYLQKKKNWQEMAKKEYSKSDYIFKVLFNETQYPRLPPPHIEMPNAFIVGSNMIEVRACGYIKEAMEDWPSFLIDLRRLFRGKVTPQIEEDIRFNAPNPDTDLSPMYKRQALSDAENYLNQARSSLSNRSFQKAVELFTFAKNAFDEASIPSRRWYLHSPFPVASNRATAAYHLQMWNLLRIDSRFTLLIKPDHERTYLRLPLISKAFGAKQLDDDFIQIVKMVENKAVSDWNKLAREVIGLLALPVIVYAAAGKLTQEMKDRAIEIGIENMYVTVNAKLENSVLPWLKESDVEPPIPNI